ncbi:AI-2E family transporter [Bacteroidia bacterium]|nr:AI-2E family transporter [Bacteroidia bacterium]
MDNDTVFSSRKTLKTWRFLLTLVVVFGIATLFFPKIIIYIVCAFVLSLVGKPIVNFLTKRCKIPIVWSSVITLIMILGLCVLFVLSIIPMVLKQAHAIQQLDIVNLEAELATLLVSIQQTLWDYNIMSKDQMLETALVEYIHSFWGSMQFSSLFSSVIHVVSNAVIGVFAVCFIGLFFLKDQNLFRQIIMLFIPTAYEVQADRILSNSQRLLVRYFTGLILDVLIIMTLLSSIMALLGVKNALLFGFIGGIFNVIPYLGPIIGATIASVLAYVAALSGGYSPDMIWIVVKIVATFLACNLLDGMFLQPTIYSNRVKAHPLEIFLVIMTAGQLAGVKGMVLAIPTYTLLRIVAKEMFHESKFVTKLTKNL